MKSAQENIDLQTTILSRFDLIFIVRDERLYERDSPSPTTSSASTPAPARIGDDGSIVPEDRRQEPSASASRSSSSSVTSRYCRATCSPRLVPSSAKLLEDQYVQYRQEMRDRAKKRRRVRGAQSAVAKAARGHHEGLGESLAKMTLQKHVTEEHVQEALRLFEVSTIDAARSGVAEMVVLTPEQREELMLVETPDQAEAALGAGVEAAPRGGPRAAGVNEWAVMRALMIMSQRGEIRERAEGRRVTRVH